MVHSSVARKIERKSCLSHRRTGRKDYEVRFLPAVSDFVQARETRRNTAVATDALQLLQTLHGLGNHCADILDAVFLPSFRGIEHLCLGTVHKDIELDFVVVGIVQDVMGSADEVALYGLLLENAQISLYMGGRSHLAGQIGHDAGTSHILQAVLLDEFVHYGNAVYRLMLIDQRYHSFENHTVPFTEKAVRLELINSLVYTTGLEEHCTEHCLFNIQSLRRGLPQLTTYLGNDIVTRFLSPFGHCYSALARGFTRIRPQFSQIISFLPEDISIRRCGVMVLKQPPQESPL